MALLIHRFPSHLPKWGKEDGIRLPVRWTLRASTAAQDTDEESFRFLPKRPTMVKRTKEPLPAEITVVPLP